MSDQENIEQWDEAYKKADTYFKTEHPIGKIVGYHHTMLIEYFKEHYIIMPNPTPSPAAHKLAEIIKKEK